jgi:hypothetical protein
MSIDETIALLQDLKETFGGGTPVFISNEDGRLVPLGRDNDALVCVNGEIETASENNEYEIIAVALHVQ